MEGTNNNEGINITFITDGPSAVSGVVSGSPSKCWRQHSYHVSNSSVRRCDFSSPACCGSEHSLQSRHLRRISNTRFSTLLQKVCILFVSSRMSDDLRRSEKQAGTYHRFRFCRIFSGILHWPSWKRRQVAGTRIPKWNDNESLGCRFVISRVSCRYDSNSPHGCRRPCVAASIFKN